MIGTTAALIMAGSAIGSKIAGAKMQSNAAKKAAQAQQQATQQAQNYYKQGMGQVGQMYAPYINAGQAAANTRARLTTPGPGARFAAEAPPNVAPQFMQPGPQGYAQPRPGPPPGVAGPYAMAEGGDMMVDRPTLFLAGEAGPERATFSGAQGGPRPMSSMGMRGQPGAGMPPLFSQMAMAGRRPAPPGMPGRAGALQGAMRGGPQGAGANALRMPFSAMFGGGGRPMPPQGGGGPQDMQQMAGRVMGGPGPYGGPSGGVMSPRPMNPPMTLDESIGAMGGGIFGGGFGGGQAPGPYGGPSGGFMGPRLNDAGDF